MYSCGNGYCFKKNGWTYIHIEGEPYERGFQHGYLLAEDMARALNAIKHYIYFMEGKEFGFFVDNANRMFTPFLEKTPEYEEEMRGIVAGAQKAGVYVSFEEILGWNGVMELNISWWPWKKRHSSIEEARIGNCSAFIATGDATKDGTIVMAHNTWEEFTIGQAFHVVMDIEPSDGFGIIMQTAPGYIASMTDFFVTSASLVGTETTIQIKKFREEGKPEFLRAREAMQYASTIESWVKMIKQDNNGGYANSWLLGDIKANEIARFELGLEYDNLTKTTNGMFVGFNAAEDPRIRNIESGRKSSYFVDIRGGVGARRLRWKQITDEYYGRIDVKAAKKMIADHYDVYLNKWNPCCRTICSHFDIDPGEFPNTCVPYSLHSALDGKVLDGELAGKMQFFARWGRPCGTPFYAAKFLEEHPQWDWQQGYLEDMPTQPWTLFGKEMSGT